MVYSAAKGVQPQLVWAHGSRVHLLPSCSSMLIFPNRLVIIGGSGANLILVANWLGGCLSHEPSEA
jgi:hypothetical protein